MCLAIPAKLVEVNGNEGTIELGGARKTVLLTLVNNPTPGQYVLVHAGYAIEVIDEAEAHEVAALQRAVFEAAEEEVTK
jgi:hydrogenase expression/formation protein HypC